LFAVEVLMLSALAWQTNEATKDKARKKAKKRLCGTGHCLLFIASSAER